VGFVAVVSWRVGNARGFLRTSFIVFALHSAGYFLGGQSMHWLLSTRDSAFSSGLSKPVLLVLAELSWGLLYGLGFGAGIGYCLHTIQNQKPPHLGASN